jgi:hypothetical protein
MDPHDQMMLANRPTTVVTQGTTLLDQMPTPFGDQGDEESMFAGIGSDHTARAPHDRRGRRRGQSIEQLADDAVAAPAPVQGKTLVLIGDSILGLSMLGFFNTKRR